MVTSGVEVGVALLGSCGRSKASCGQGQSTGSLHRATAGRCRWTCHRRRPALEDSPGRRHQVTVCKGASHVQRVLHSAGSTSKAFCNTVLF